MKPLKLFYWHCRTCFNNPPAIPVELQHKAGDGHAPGNLEGHAAEEVHAVSRVGVEGRVVQLLGVVQLLLCGARRDGSRPAGQTHHTINTLTRAVSWEMPYSAHFYFESHLIFKYVALFGASHNSIQQGDLHQQRRNIPLTWREKMNHALILHQLCPSAPWHNSALTATRGVGYCII